MMMGKFVCAVALTLMAASAINAAAIEQDDYGFAVESQSPSNISVSLSPTFGNFGAPSFRQFAPSQGAPGFAPTYGVPVYRGPAFGGPAYAPALRTFGPVEIYRPSARVDFF